MAPEFLASVYVMLKPLVNDPQGLAVADGLRTLGFEDVRSVRVGKRVEVTVEADSADSAEARVRAMCQQLLANPVIEDFELSVTELERAGS